MKFSQKLIASAVLLATSAVAIAATDTTTVEINVTKGALVNFTGTLATSPTVTLDVNTMGGVTTTLGTLGLSSNTVGTCTVTFASANDYKLVHADDAAIDLGVYTINYAGTTNTSGTSNDYVATTCNETASNMDIAHPALPAVVTAGTYEDTLTMVVTTQ